MTRQPKPLDSRTRAALAQLDTKYKAATSRGDQRAIADEALDVLAAKSDPKPSNGGS